MTPQELKNSILQLAIQGKLVEQRADEGTGRELLEKIFAAKDAKKNFTRSRGVRGGCEEGELFNLPEAAKSHHGKFASPREEISDDEKPFEIPESWEWVKLGVCCEMYTGNSISEGEKRAKYEGRKEGLDYIGTKDVSFKQTIFYNNGVKIPFDNEMGFRKARAGAILLCVEGGSAGRKIAILDRDVCFGNKLCMFMPKTLLNTYLFFFLQSMEFRKVFSENMTGIIGGVSIKKLKEIVLPLPPLAEQKRIVAKIEELMPLVDRYEKAWSKLKDFNKRFPADMQKSLLQMAIQGKLVEQRAEEGTGRELLEKILAAKNAEGAKGRGEKSHAKSAKSAKVGSYVSREEIPDDEKPFDIPESWEWVRLGEVAEKVTDGTHKTPHYTDNGVQFVSAKDLCGGRLRFDKCKHISEQEHQELFARCNPERGDLLISKSGSIGAVALVDVEFEFSLFESLALVKYNQEKVFPKYLKCAVQATCLNLKPESVRGVAVKHLPIADIKTLPIPLPPLAEQKRIVAKLEELLPLCERLK